MELNRHIRNASGTRTTAKDHFFHLKPEIHIPTFCRSTLVDQRGSKVDDGLAFDHVSGAVAVGVLGVRFAGHTEAHAPLITSPNEMQILIIT